MWENRLWYILAGEGNVSQAGHRNDVNAFQHYIKLILVKSWDSIYEEPIKRDNYEINKYYFFIYIDNKGSIDTSYDKNYISIK